MSELPTYVRAHAGGACLQVKVGPRAPRNEVGEVLGDRIKIKIAAPPVDSAANEELVAFIAKQLGVSRGAVQITHGQTSRNKTVQIAGVTVDHCRAALKQWCRNVPGVEWPQKGAESAKGKTDCQFAD